jgi:hypothetical protein
MEFIKNKLITKEDPFHVHKVFGIISLFHFIYQYVYFIFFKRFNLHLVGMCIHVTLSFSALLFDVVKNRILSRPLIIWNEYRAHAIVFTCRSFCVYLCYEYQITPFWKIIIIVLHHLIVDYLTYLYGNQLTTTVRHTDNTTSLFRKCGHKLYSLYQFHAQVSQFMVSNVVGEMGFNSIIAIQSSAFLMTLNKKSIIRPITHTIIYSLCLLLSSYVIVHHLGYITIIYAIFMLSLRHLNINKYLLYVGFYVLVLKLE